MSRTPPRLKSVFSSKPLSKLNLKTAYAEIRRESKPTPAPAITISALMFGRALDAASRSDSDFFMDETSPLLAIGDALSEILRRTTGDFADILKNLERNDPIEISVALDRMRQILSPDPSSPEAVVRAVSLSSELLAAVRPDPGLDEKTACHVLTHAALEAYYLRGATTAAKKELDSSRQLINLATGTSVDFIQPEQQLEIGLEVWEAWQSVQALDHCFGLRTLAGEMEQRGAFAIAGLAHGAEVLLRANGSKIDRDAIADSIAALVKFAGDRGRKSSRTPEPNELGTAVDSRSGAIVSDGFEVDREDTMPDLRLETTPTQQMRSIVAPSTTERAEIAKIARKKPRPIAAIIEDMLSVIERYDILINGDDNSLVFEVAPMLQHSLRVLYGELELFHPQQEAVIYSDESAGRDVQALRMMVTKAFDLDARFAQLKDALASSSLEVGFATDDETIPGPTQVDPAIRGRAEALLIVLDARKIAIGPAHRAAVLRCTEGQLINRWLARAAIVSSVEQVFED